MLARRKPTELDNMNHLRVKAARRAAELKTALSDLLREVHKINDICLPDGFDARAVRNAEAALAATAGVAVTPPKQEGGV